MQALARITLILFLFSLTGQLARADDYEATLKSFRNAGESGAYFDNSFGYAVSMSGDTAIVGAYGDDDSSGSVYFFTDLGFD